MIKYKLILVVQSIALVAGGLVLGYLSSMGYWISTFFISGMIIFLIIAVYDRQLKTTNAMKRFVSAIRFSDFSLTFQRTGQKEISSELAASLDIALKQFRDKLQQIEARNQYHNILLSTIDSGMFVIDRNGQVEWFNKAAMKELGKTRMEKISELKSLHPSFPDILAALHPGETKILKINKDNITYELAINGTLFKIQGRELILVSLKNIHSVLEANEIEAWQKLIRVLTHEIMNSITPIISLSETVTDRAATNDMNEKDYSVMLQAIQVIHRRSRGLLEFVENYRKLTRIPAPEITPIPVNDLITDLQKLFSTDKFEYVFKNEQQNLTILADRTQIEQVLINLIRNAEEACKECLAPRIEITATRRENHINLSVRDNGKGIIPEAIDKIFVPFFTTKPGGSGIGLSLCKQIMSLHGGNITVSTENGKGSTFTLHFRA